jgi:hypothetical protein
MTEAPGRCRSRQCDLRRSRGLLSSMPPPCVKFITGMLRMPAITEGAHSRHASSVMYPLSVITIVDPGAAPCATRNASVQPVTLRTPGGRMTLGPVEPAVLPVRYTEIVTREDAVSFSCLRR